MSRTYTVVQSHLYGLKFSVIEFTDGADAREIARFYYRREADDYAASRTSAGICGHAVAAGSGAEHELAYYTGPRWTIEETFALVDQLWEDRPDPIEMFEAMGVLKRTKP
jgi:hypothetical protein